MKDPQRSRDPMGQGDERADGSREKNYGGRELGGLTKSEMNSDPEVNLGGADAVPDLPHSAGARGADVNQPGEQRAGERKGGK